MTQDNNDDDDDDDDDVGWQYWWSHSPIAYTELATQPNQSKHCGNLVTPTTMYFTQDAPIKIYMLYKQRPDLYIAEWLSRQNHAESKGKKYQV